MAPNYEERIRLANEELLGRGNLAAVDDFFCVDYRAHGGGKDYQGTDFARRFIKRLRSAFPNLEVLEVLCLNQNGSTLTWRRTLRGTHEKKMQGIPASGKQVQWEEMLVSRFEGNKIAEEWLVSDLAGRLFSKLPGQDT